ncbi:hypothetical protein Emed_007171 [Eimeria media]
MLPLAPLVLSVLTLDVSVLGVAAAVDSTDGSSAFLQKTSESNIFAVEEDWGLRRLNAFDFGELEETPDDAADDELQGGLESRHLAAVEAEAATGLQQEEVAVEEQAKQDPEEVEELEHRRVMRTLPKLPGVKGIKTFLFAAVVMFCGAYLTNRALNVYDRQEVVEDEVAGRIFSYVGLSIMGVGLLISLIAFTRLGMSGYKRRQWVKQAQQAILAYQQELQAAEEKGQEESQGVEATGDEAES